MTDKIGIIVDEDFATQHIPPYPRPSILAFETPFRIETIYAYFEKIAIFDDKRLKALTPKEINDSILELASSKYNIDTIKRFSNKGGGYLNDEVFIVKDTFNIAKKALGGVIKSVESVLDGEVGQSFALVRPPGHHATRDKPSGLCIFNNIANTIYYLREKRGYNKKIAIIDIDDHFGDGICQYFYEDPDVLYFSIHEFDFVDGDIGNIDELGEDEGLGKNICFPVPSGIIDENFLVFFDLLEPIIKEFQPDIIIVATGFDMYYADPVGNCNLTSYSYYKFAEWISSIAKEVCGGKLTFVLEGGYSLIGLPICIDSMIKALLHEDYERPETEMMDLSFLSQQEEVLQIRESLLNLLKPFWSSLK